MMSLFPGYHLLFRNIVLHKQHVKSRLHGYTNHLKIWKFGGIKLGNAARGKNRREESVSYPNGAFIHSPDRLAHSVQTFPWLKYRALWAWRWARACCFWWLRYFFLNPVLRRPTPHSMFGFNLHCSTPSKVHGYATRHILHDVQLCWFGVSMRHQSYLTGKILCAVVNTRPFYRQWARLSY